MQILLSRCIKDFYQIIETELDNVNAPQRIIGQIYVRSESMIFCNIFLEEDVFLPEEKEAFDCLIEEAKETTQFINPNWK